MPDALHRLAIGLLLMLAFTACETAQPDQTPRLIMDPPEDTEQKPESSGPR